MIDGKDIWPLMSAQPGARTPHDAFYYYGADLFGQPGAKEPSPGFDAPKLEAIRSGDWKLHLSAEGLRGTALYDLGSDVGETKDVLGKHLDVVARLEQAARKFNDELKKNIRPLGR